MKSFRYCCHRQLGVVTSIDLDCRSCMLPLHVLCISECGFSDSTSGYTLSQPSDNDNTPDSASGVAKYECTYPNTNVAKQYYRTFRVVQ